MSQAPTAPRQTDSIYLVFKDGTQLFLTPEHIERATERFWSDPTKVPDTLKAAVDFQRCVQCPMSHDKKICDALRPILPLLEYTDTYNSFDPVQVVYMSDDPGVSYIANTTMQYVLSFVSFLSLINYCQAGRKFRKYYFGIIPLISSTLLAGKLFLNIYWLHQGNRNEIDHITKQLNQVVQGICQNQVKRLSLISKNDAFNNAFVNAHISTALLTMGIERELQKAFAQFEAAP